MIDLYYWGTPNGKKITIALEEFGLAYNLIPIDILNDEQYSPKFLAISPNNKIPAIVDHDTANAQPLAIFESGAILQYLGRKTGQFYPTDEHQRALVEEWLMWQMAGVGPNLAQNNHFIHYASEPIPYALTRFKKETERLYGVLEKQLDGQDYVAGEFSIADIAIFPWVDTYEKQEINLNEFPNVAAYLKRMHARPAVIKALAIDV